MNQTLPLVASLGLLVTACSGTIDASGTIEAGHPEAATSTSAGSGGNDGAVGVGGSSAGRGTGDTGGGGTGGDGATTVASGTGGMGGAGGHSEMDAAEDERGQGGSADAGGQDGASALLDYSIWQLQLPTGSGTSPTTVAPKALASFSDIYFYRADDGGQIFMDPDTGITTSGSSHPRTELRESNAAGDAAAWSPSATNSMTVTGKVLKGSDVTIAQVFNGSDATTLAELQYSSNGFSLFYEEVKGQGGSNNNLGFSAPLNTQYTFTLGFSNNVLTVALNGKQVYMHAPSARVLASKFYFKVGNYDQTASGGSVGTTAHSIVEDYSVVVVHQ